MTNQPDARMLIIVPTRSRPENVEKVVRAWEETDAFRHADLVFGVDMDDPKFHAYEAAIDHCHPNVKRCSIPQWQPLVPKLNDLAMSYLKHYPGEYFALGFAGDDHLPRTKGWAEAYVTYLAMMGTGVVSCPDGYRPDQLPTQWAMTADIVRALGRMVPAPVEHLYCDNAVQDLAEAAGCYAYLDDVLIEHMHPLAGKTKFDDQYRHVNRPDQFRQDEALYAVWKHGAGHPDARTLKRDAEIVRALRSSSIPPNPGGGS